LGFGTSMAGWLLLHASKHGFLKRRDVVDLKRVALAALFFAFFLVCSNRAGTGKLIRYDGDRKDRDSH
ncbi:MAG: hypothetical protein ACI9SB_002624, partial [Candidatus Azotimanducaceae bacterium]